ncbi:nuclear transport factor 2 family protein [Hymenobacter sp. BT523]|uniref:nuclear transport factor 2 family protein n=1 Tax=Hymenobacter sp. BT523 TaxID=2795725 RepID=UPI0018ED69EF|nr:nuclear transport factor 2 family protein [Hymenobacter sp. BT523]MBJ6111825.1 nuclear transport factor 2 family protein [Hymenobacter sp. BT523]
MSTIAEIEQLERRRFDAQVAKDLPTLEAIFADDLVYTHSNGHQDDKASYLASIASGQSRYDRVDFESLTVRAYNDDRTAVVNGLVRIELGPGADGQPTFTRIKYVVVYIRTDAHGWQLVLWHAQKQAA